MDPGVRGDRDGRRDRRLPDDDRPDQRQSRCGTCSTGNNDPWMFHQANTRDYDGGGHSLLSDLLTATFDKYTAAATLPIVSPTMDDLATRVTNRMTFDASGVVATIQPRTSVTDQRHRGRHRAGDGALCPRRGELRRTDDLVSPSRCRPVGDVVSHDLQPRLRNGRHRWSLRGERVLPAGAAERAATADRHGSGISSGAGGTRAATVARRDGSSPRGGSDRRRWRDGRRRRPRRRDGRRTHGRSRLVRRHRGWR